MRWLSRVIGLIFAAGAFVAFVIDGAKSIADDALQTQPVGAVWVYLNEASFTAAQDAVVRNLSPLLWEHLVQPVLMLPFFVFLILVATMFLFLGRRPRSRIGYAMRG
jgi:hypothetical protein